MLVDGTDIRLYLLTQFVLGTSIRSIVIQVAQQWGVLSASGFWPSIVAEK
jgi:hypothetical protein